MITHNRRSTKKDKSGRHKSVAGAVVGATSSQDGPEAAHHDGHEQLHTNDRVNMRTVLKLAYFNVELNQCKIITTFENGD